MKMDVARGHCWRCEVKLPKDRTKACPYCRTGTYCSERCLKDDLTRHFVECDMWKPRSCDHCGKKADDLKKCAGCFSFSYCGSKCQDSSWMKHKAVCRQWQRIVKEVALWRREYCEQSFGKNGVENGFPNYFRSTLATDLLKLTENEFNRHKVDDIHFERDFNLLLAGCGDACHLVYTVYALPSQFTGRLHFTLNDNNHFLMARNVLLLYMIYSSTETGEKTLASVATVWMSTRLSLEDFALLKESLAELFAIDAKTLFERTNGMMKITEEVLESLRKAWEGWNELVCHTSRKGHFDLDSQRQAIFENHRIQSDTMNAYKSSVPKKLNRSINKWFKNGIVDGHRGNHKLPYYNPTFTSPQRNQMMNKRTHSPRRHPFAYCIPADSLPFQCWDFLEFKKFGGHDNVPALCHSLVTTACHSTKTLMDERRLSIEINTDNFVHLGNDHSGKTFDRIFTSCLADTYGHDKVIECLEPLLSEDNPLAVLFTEGHEWAKFMENDAEMTSNVIKLMGVHAKAELDTKIKRERAMRYGDAHLIEYYNNNVHFINYLRAEKMASSMTAPYSTKVSDIRIKLPTWTDSTKYHGLKMRNFRKERNAVIPFRFRRNIRAVNMLSGFVRTLEWYRPSTCEDQSPQFSVTCVGEDESEV